MDKGLMIWLTDIKSAIIEINQFLPEKKSFSEFQTSIKTKRAVERNIEIIGEAVNRIMKVQPDIAIQTQEELLITRNRIIHGCNSVSDDIIWVIATIIFSKNLLD